MDDKEYDVILIPQPEGGYTVSVPELPDVVTEGETRQQALDMARDAIEGYLETMQEKGWVPQQALHQRVVITQPRRTAPIAQALKPRKACAA